ncbi:D-glycero-beta-D-manno-heptose 1-phosphate adenylyltransferase [bacterium]|nr:D-glycero-beta-D-manno-heptose 1-phosphate adenylyltransferase [bacterium]
MRDYRRPGFSFYKLESSFILADEGSLPRSPLSWDAASKWCLEMQKDRHSVVFTNGVFDILHPGHVEVLEQSRALGDRLIVGVNSDESVKRLKGEKRPIVPEMQRAALLLGLKAVDEVVLFDQDTPAELIALLKPDVLVKGGDYTPETVVGRDTVEKNGGKVVIIPLVEGLSTTNVVDTVIERYCRSIKS